MRRINISGNEDTSDEVFRRELRQIEGAQYSISKIENSRSRLQRLPYVTAARIETIPVEGVDNQVDLNVNVEEHFSGNVSISAGYSKSDGAVLTFSLNQENFLGSGNRVNFTFSNNDSDSNYTVGFTDPYHTLDGVSRSLYGSYRSIDYRERDISNIASSSSDQLHLSLDYGFPVSENDVFNLGGQFQKIAITLQDGAYRRANNRNDVNQLEVISCIEENAGDFNNYSLNSGFSYDTRDRSRLTTSGARISANAQIYTPFSDSKYYKADYSHRHYFPLDSAASYIFSAHGRASYANAYGGSCIPYFDKYYAGGARDIRGYANNSLGPQDTRQRSVGGNFRTYANFDLFVPSDFLYDSDKLRMGPFMDIGNVYNDIDDFDLGTLRGSYGLQVQWLTAFGGISLIFAEQFNDEENDRTEKFQFELGTSF